MAQHYWLKQRALRLQNLCFDEDGNCDEKSFALYLPYQATHDRAFHKALNTFLKLRADKRKAEIGFVSQQAKLNRARGVRSTSASALQQRKLKSVNRSSTNGKFCARRPKLTTAFC